MNINVGRLYTMKGGEHQFEDNKMVDPQDVTSVLRDKYLQMTTDLRSFHMPRTHTTGIVTQEFDVGVSCFDIGVELVIYKLI